MGREANENLYFCANPDFSGLGMASTESGVTTGLQLFFFQEPRSRHTEPAILNFNINYVINFEIRNNSALL